MSTFNNNQNEELKKTSLLGLNLLRAIVIIIGIVGAIFVLCKLTNVFNLLESLIL